MAPSYRDIDLHTLTWLLNNDQTTHVRPAKRRRDPPVPAAHHTVAYFAANPDGTRPLKLAEESSEIQREIALAPHRDDFKFHSRLAASTLDFWRDLNTLDPQVIHLAGHGNTRGFILQDEHGHPNLMSPRALAKLVRAAARSVRVIVLNGCETTSHAEALCDTAEVIVAMAGPITDAAARLFASTFYGALGNRRSIGNAVEQGIAMLASKELPDEELPRCVHRPDVDPFEVFLPACRRSRAAR